MAQIAAQRYTGTSVRRSEDPRILAGRGRYIADLKLPGMLHAAFVRSPLAHGRVLAVDASAARALPGVVAVFTGADLAEMTIPGPDPLLAMMGGGGPMPEYSPARDGQGALRGRPGRDRGRREPLPGRGRLRARRGRLRGPARDRERGVPPWPRAVPRCSPTWTTTSSARTRAGSTATSPGRSRAPTGSPSSTSTCTATRTCPWRDAASWRATTPGSGTMTFHAATQSVHVTRMGVAGCLGLEPGKVRVLADDIGGSFGLKMGVSREELAVAAAARAVGRPVKWIEDRSENLTASGQAREESFDVRAAVSDGRRPARAGREDGDRHRRVPGDGHDGPGDRRGDAARPVQARGAGLRVDRGHHQQGVVRRLPRPVGVRDVRPGTRPRPARQGPRPGPARDPAAQRRPAHQPPARHGAPGARSSGSPRRSRWSASPRSWTSRPSGGARPASAPAAVTWASAWRPSSRALPARVHPGLPAARWAWSTCACGSPKTAS